MVAPVFLNPSGETNMRWTVNEIKEHMRKRGSHWFDPDTMRCFGTEVLPEVYQGRGGIFFVTRDFQFDKQRPKRYTVRQFDPEDGIHTLGSINDYADQDEAVEAAKKAAMSPRGEYETVTEDFKPVTVLEQFLTDLDKHSSHPAKVMTVDAKRLITHAKRHQLLMELLCSDEAFCREIPEDGEHPQVTDCRARCQQAAKRLGATSVIFSGDPRGCTVKLVFADGFTNDWGNEGYCVPTEE
jgi:hypothetical protein